MFDSDSCSRQPHAIIPGNIHSDRVAILSGGQAFSYDQLSVSSDAVASYLLIDRADLKEERVAFMVTPGFDYVRVLWGIWKAGGVAVPLCITHPAPALEYVLNDTGCGIVIVSPEFASILEPLCEPQGISMHILSTWPSSTLRRLPTDDPQRRAMILYTSGTTNVPKGVVTTHRNIQAQITTLVKAWRWRQDDHTLCVLPLHHVHGIINVVSCALWSGACCEFLPEFDAQRVLDIFRKGEVNVFMAVPTIYYKLITAFDQLPKPEQDHLMHAMKKMRLMVSGSAALPMSVMERWETISGHRLLERYGMTELGMAISNPYDGERRAGCIGLPLNGVDVRLCDEKDRVVHDEPGEIQVRGENVFLEYWNKPAETKKSFTEDGWFRTGDVAVLEKGYYRILGRNSVDIIKSGGYKISALEIEEVLRTHPDIQDCAVVGLEDVEWGEIVAAALVTRNPIQALDLQDWLKTRIPSYRVPRKILTVNDLPRNAMGKVVKNEVKKLFDR